MQKGRTAALDAQRMGVLSIMDGCSRNRTGGGLVLQLECAAANHFGDWFGSTVNLASRLTARARPSSVLVTEEVRDALGEDGYAVSSAGPKRLKGIAEPVRTFRVRREPDG